MLNHYKTPKIKQETSIITTIFLLLLLGTLSLTSTSIKIIGDLALIVSMVLAQSFILICFLITMKINKTHFTILVLSVLFVFVAFVSTLNNMSTLGILNILKFWLCIGMVFFLSMINWDNKKIKHLGILSTLFIMIHFIVWIKSNFSFQFASIYRNPNNFAPIILYTLFFILLAKKRLGKNLSANWYLLVSFFLSIILLYTSNSRSVIFSGLFVIFTFMLWNVITKTRLRFVLYIISLITGLIMILIVYPLLPKWEYFAYFDELMREYTGKRIMSGRQDIWMSVFQAVENQPLFGFGSGASPSIVTSQISSSTHNLFLHILLQNGYLGLILFLLILILIWTTFWKKRDDSTVKLVGAFFVGVLIHQSFEITMTQNMLTIGMLQWFIISIGISRVLHE